MLLNEVLRENVLDYSLFLWDSFLQTSSIFGIYFCRFLKRFYLFIFRKSGREGEREVKKHQCAENY